MKKTFYLIPILVLLFVLAACGSSGAEVSAVDDMVADSSAGGLVDEPMVESENEDSMESDDMSTPQHPQEEMIEEMPDQSSDMAGESEDMAAVDSEDDDMEEDSSMDDQMASDDMDDDSMDDDDMDDDTMAVDLPAWQTSALVDAQTGDSFTLADFAGKTVFVEPMATWCTNCRRQLTNVSAAKQQLGSEDVVFIALSVETNIDDTELANYADDAGFDWLFAVMTPDLLRQMADEFGQAITNPPATPHFIIRPDGTFTELVTGIEPAGDIISQIQAAQG